MWFKLVSVPLRNATADYPEGDDVGVATLWRPRPMFEGMDENQLSAVFGVLRSTVHGPTKQAKNMPWAGKPLMEMGGRNESEASKIVKTWLASGVLRLGTYYHATSKHNVQRVNLDETKATAIFPAPEPVDAPAD